MKTPQQGAATSIELASSPKVEGVTGTYFANGRPQSSNTASYDAGAAARLWQVSASLVGLPAAVQPDPTSNTDGRATYGRHPANLMTDDRKPT